VPQIAEMLQVKRPTVQSWKQRDGWDETAPINRVESSLEARLIQLIAKPQKSGGDFKVADFSAADGALARVNRYSQTGNEVDLNPNVANRNKGDRKKPKRTFQRRGYRETGGIIFRPVFRVSAAVVPRRAGAPYSRHSQIAPDWRDVLFPRGAAARAQNRP
jgi:hypothetical protein